MKRRQTRRFSRKQRRKTRKTKRFSRKQKGGVNLPVPEGSVVGVDLDPQDPYSVPILVSKQKFEEEVLED